MTKQLILFASLWCALGINAQELERELRMSVEKAQHYEKERAFGEEAERVYRSGGIVLPFIDDFARYSLPTNNPDIPDEWQMWTDDHARINNSLPLNPLTIGVATLDGLDRTGYPYDFDSPHSYGPADTLTSCPIDLGGYVASDSVKLVFHYQSGGMGNEANFQDSLILEFLIPNADPPVWQWVWSIPGTTVSEFEREFVHIDSEFWLQSDFQFRFRNYATLSGNVDHWHLDYIWLNDNIEDANFEIVDISVTGHETSLLENYNSMPWEHFQVDPESHMEDDEFIRFNNLDDDRNITFGAEILFDGVSQAVLAQNPSTADNGFSFIDRQFSINDGSPHNYVFDGTADDTCATFQVKCFCNTTPDFSQTNDTLTFDQHFGNYYAYDDGSAESVYSLNEEGSAMAVRYNTSVTDSLIGLLIHFNPFTLDSSEELFLLRAWQDVGGEIGPQYEEQFLSHYPNYFTDGYDIFEFYEYDSPINIEAGDFYVGFVQSNAEEIRVGVDKHNNTNTDNLYFRIGPSGLWQQSGVTGSLMIRPVFQTDKPLGWDFVNVDELDGSAASKMFDVYPNPAANILTSQDFKNGSTVKILSSTGSVVFQETISSPQVEIDHLSAGLYLIQLYDGSDFVGVSKFLKR